MEETANIQEQEVKEAETGTLKAKISELENASGEKDRQIAGLKQTLTEAESRQNELNNSLTVAIKSYKTLIADTNTNIPAELLGGDTIEAIDESLAKAKLVVGKIRQVVEAEGVSVRVPGGAPARTAVDFSGMSPSEKIRYSVNSKMGM